MCEANRMVPFDRLDQAARGARSVVGVGPRAVDVGKLVQSVWMSTNRFRDVIVVVGIVVDPGTDNRRLGDPILVHLEEQLFDEASALRIRDRRLVWPVTPGVTVRIDNLSVGSGHLSVLSGCHRTASMIRPAEGARKVDGRRGGWNLDGQGWGKRWSDYPFVGSPRSPLIEAN